VLGSKEMKANTVCPIDFTMPAESGAGISTPTAAAATAKDQKGVVSGAAERLADKAPGAGGKKKKKGKK